MTDVLLVGAEELENLSTRYLAAVLRQHGFSVELAAFSAPADAESVLQRAKRCQPRLIGLSIIFQYRAPEFLALASGLRQLLPQAHITAGGHFATFAARELLRDYLVLDSVVRGEGELTLLELMQQVDAPAHWGKVVGLSFRRASKAAGGLPDEVIETPWRPLITDLDTLPFPSRDTPPQRHLGIAFSPIVGSRGCHQDCAFCSIRSFYGASRGRSQRFRSVPNLIDEMETLYRRYGVRFFVFNDDEWFPAGPARYGRVEQFEAELRRRRLELIMSIKCRADDVEVDLFQRLFEMGVVRAYVGVESGSDHSLRTLNKRTTAAENRHALQVLQQVGMLADFGLIIFDPDSTVEDIRANLNFLREMGGAGQAPLSFGRMEVYAGTPILARLQAEHRLTGNYMAWNYTIADPRVEMLWRLMIATMRHRQYDNRGLGKQCSIAYYELMIYRHLHAARYDPALGEALRQIVARVNTHSLAMFEEMFAFAQHGDIADTAVVNKHAAAWATQINVFDLETEAELADWRAAVAAHVHPSTKDRLLSGIRPWLRRRVPHGQVADEATR
ncbi:MAG: B12-binding domain-containing radical SAM protein [Anaerolineales bacterium]|nr:B12-binding domain-containing radical SAM protein [Anaerolineales bacterium]